MGEGEELMGEQRQREIEWGGGGYGGGNGGSGGGNGLGAEAFYESYRVCKEVSRGEKRETH